MFHALPEERQMLVVEGDGSFAKHWRELGNENFLSNPVLDGVGSYVQALNRSTREDVEAVVRELLK